MAAQHKVNVTGVYNTQGKLLSGAQVFVQGAASKTATTAPTVLSVDGEKVNLTVTSIEGVSNGGTVLPTNETYISVMIIVQGKQAVIRVVDENAVADIAGLNLPATAPAIEIPVHTAIQRSYSRVWNANAAAGVGCVAGTVVSQNNDTDTIVPLSSVSCNAGGLHTDNYYARQFTGLTPGEQIQCVDWAVEESISASGGGVPYTMNIYDATGCIPESNGPDPTCAPGSCYVLLDSVSDVVPDGIAPGFVTTTIGGIIPASGSILVEVFTPEGQTDGNSLFVGSNQGGQTGSTYLAAEACGLLCYLPTEAIGFPDMQWVVEVGLGEPVIEDGACCDTSSGTCTETTNVDCEFDFTAGVTCNDIPCDIFVPGSTCDDCIGINAGDTVVANNTGAGDNGSSSCDFGNEIDQWFCYTATCNGTALANTCDSALDTVLTVYDGCGGAEITCNDDNDNGECTGGLQSAVSWPVTAGTTYYMSVTGWNGGEGDYQLTVTEEDCQEPECPQWPACGEGAGPCDAANGSPGCDDVGCCCDVCDADPFCCETEWDSICADTAAAVCAPPPEGNGAANCTDGPTAISGEGNFPFNTADGGGQAPDGPGDVLCDKFGSNQIDNDIWYCWTNTCDNPGNVTVQTCGLTGADTKMAVYDGCECPAENTALDCNDDTCGLQSLVTIPDAQPGGQYLIRLGSFPGAAGGPGEFSITCPIDTGDLPCDQPDENCQNYATDNASQSNDTAFHSYDEFTPDFTGDITSICWWGAYIPALAGDNFRVEYYADAGGVPGANIGTFTQGVDLTVDGPADTGDLVANVAPIYEYTGDHAAVGVTAGECYWISVVNNPEAGATWFWEWSFDPLGNGQLCVDAGLDGCQAGDIQAGNDASWCLNGALGDADACTVVPECTDLFPACDMGDGNCQEANGSVGCNIEDCCCLICGADAFCCETEWDQICADAAIAAGGVCAGVQGGCCFDDGSCEVLTADDCAAAGGSYAGDDTDCSVCPVGGRCCSDTCDILTEAACEAAGGDYLGDGLTCEQGVGANHPISGGGGAIPDDSTPGLSVSINQPDSFTIAEVELDVNITHTWVGDLCVTLTHEDTGTSATVINRPGDNAGLICDTNGCCGCSDDNIGVSLDDDAASNVNDECFGGGIFGTLQPDLGGLLSAFDGEDAAGTWTLTVNDNAGGDLGTLDSWTVNMFEPGGGGEICPPFGACCCVGDCFESNQADCDAAGGNWLEGENCDLPPGEVTQIDSGDLGLAIPDASTDTASHTLNMGMDFAVQDVDISVGITHTWVGDLCVTLTHEDTGTSATLIQRMGDDGLGCDAAGCCGCSEDNMSVTLDDAAGGGSINDQCATNLSGEYTPENPLAVFNGESSAGAWTISVNDNAGGDLGTLDNWSISLQAPGSGGDICENNCCGDGVVSPNEDCEPSLTECCNADCTFSDAGSACGDGTVNDCTGADTCDGAGGCEANDAAAGTDCGDGPNECSGQDTCNGSGTCNANDLPGGTPCGNPPVGEDCFLGDVCTGGGVCQPGSFETECGPGLDGCCPDGCNFTNDDDCPEPVPTVSEWGLVILALLLAAAAKVYFSRRESLA
jgi:subtilisin-like proprotein convertase family protein